MEGSGETFETTIFQIMSNLISISMLQNYHLICKFLQEMLVWRQCYSLLTILYSWEAILYWEPGFSSNLPALEKLEEANLVRMAELDKIKMKVSSCSSAKALICLWLVHPIYKCYFNLNTDLDSDLKIDQVNQ